MLIFVIAVVAIMFPVLLGIALALGTARLETAVVETKAAVENKDRGYNPAVTLGHKIKVNAGVDEQLREARLLAARRAATLPRGANMRIGRLGHENLRTASEGLSHDPLTAVRIAAFHGWDGARVGAPSVGVPVAAPVAAPTAVPAPATDGEIELAPGKDYPFIEITDDMPPEEVRKARIANAKAKSAAMKAAKAARETSGVAAAAPTAAAPAAPVAPAPAVAAPTTIPEPQYIEISDDMSPEEVRKARIANAKAKSAYNKALKAAGFDLEGGGTPPVADATFKEPDAGPAATPAEPTPATMVEPAAVPANIPKPDYIEITDDMPPEQIRQARIHNSKARSQYNKALKAAGIDPQTVS